MLAISEHLRNHGYDPQIERHTSIPGIWQKLRTLYNMDIIDEREMSFDYEDDGEDKFFDFKLPEEDYEEALWLRGRRTASDAPSSPPRLNRSPSPSTSVQPAKKRRRGTVTRRREETVDDTDDTRTSQMPSSPPLKPTRGRQTTNKLKARPKAPMSRQESKDTTVDEDVEEAEETADSGPEAEDDDTPSPKIARGSAKGKEIPATRKSRRKR